MNVKGLFSRMTEPSKNFSLFFVVVVVVVSQAINYTEYKLDEYSSRFRFPNVEIKAPFTKYCFPVEENIYFSIDAG